MPRLFTGLEVPESLGLSLSFLRGGLIGAKWIDPENYHVTLRFIGDVDQRTADEVAQELARVRRQRFDVRIEGVTVFGGRQPHSLVAKVAASAALSELQAEHERICQRLGLPAEPRRFTPHVTIARCKAASHEGVAQWLALRGGFAGVTFTADRFVLFSSKASRGGGPYVTEETYDLAPATAGGGLGRAPTRIAPIVGRLHPRFATSA
ncbi:RNA 2',3'-cyclic phosphodiesterase [Siculibacillus lacustris]|uniref:RNA 2',3'-cyclic phosphodiesterase n=1 Tax=Siculibacillus lacustris TaxID=1549641 RepID=A0A4Q9VLN0_9HYPH|nr:RNA 2',3'-cyclic phosphodiesterase [Siculibacillus lacustris]